MKFVKSTLIIISLLFAFSSVMGQVTNSAMSGSVRDNNGEPLIGATIEAVHTPSGTSYGVATQADGRYAIPNMRVGGPYRVVASYLGYSTQTYEDINLRLGDNFILNVVLNEEGIELEGVQVIAFNNSILNGERTGAETNISSRELSSMPTINRSINDFTRMTPQSNGNSFGGRDSRYNNIQIDGANFNNNFGLDANNILPGGSAQPISLDAIEEIQVNIAPYDVRQTNFTGAGINAITKSGTNTFSGTAYTLFRNQSFNGNRIGDFDLPEATQSTTNIYGIALGGPIIKDKLFFFVNAEIDNSVTPGIDWVPNNGSNSGEPNVSRTTVEDLERVSSHLRELYGYETGDYRDYPNNFTTGNWKALARLDWNINQSNKFTIRYNQVAGTSDQFVNGNSAPNPRASSNRLSQNAFAFPNANYGFENTVASLTAELNSSIGNNMSNQLLASFTRIQDKRTSGSSPFPFVDIWEDGDAYMSFGYELFSYRNEVLNDAITITDNFTYTVGRHEITAGASLDILTFGNSFRRYGTSYYRFNSVDDFINNASPSAFGLTYSLLPGGEEPYAELKFGLGGLYIQDRFAVTDKFRLTIGLRADMPIYLEDPIANPAVSELRFENETQVDLGAWPNTQILLSPRVGFNYDVYDDRSFQIRGGTGIFTGRLPWVWFTNQPTNSGMIQNTVELNADQVLANNITFDPAIDAHNDKFPQNAGTSSPGSLAFVDPDFKMPQVFRTNIGLDKNLTNDIIFTFDALYTKDINAIVQRNINQRGPVGNLQGADNRPLYDRTTLDDIRYETGVNEVMMLTNTNEGFSTSLTGQLTKRFKNNWSGMLAYTYTMSKDLSSNPGSQAASAWSNVQAVRGQNNLDLAFADFAVPHRIVGSFSYRLEYAGFMATTFSLFYSGSHQGRYSYRYFSDINNDGINADLIYVPADPSEINFVDIVDEGEVVFTAAQQSAAFFQYIDNNKYLSDRKGEYAERSGALLPWLHRMDLRVLQDFSIKTSTRTHTFQLSLDVLNFMNLLNSEWGVLNRTVVNNAAILVPAGTNNEGEPQFRLPTIQGGEALPTEAFENVLNRSTTWGAQIGLRYIF